MDLIFSALFGVLFLLLAILHGQFIHLRDRVRDLEEVQEQLRK